MTTKDIAWIAGLIEGEGCFSQTKGSITAQLSMTDEDIVRRSGGLVKAPSIGVHNSQVRNGRKVSYRWTLCGTPAASWMMTIYPFMGERRRTRIRELLELWKSTRPYRVSVTNCPHTTRRHQGRGMCKACYQLDWYHRTKGGEAKDERPTATSVV